MTTGGGAPGTAASDGGSPPCSVGHLPAAIRQRAGSYPAACRQRAGSYSLLAAGRLPYLYNARTITKRSKSMAGRQAGGMAGHFKMENLPVIDPVSRACHQLSNPTSSTASNDEGSNMFLLSIYMIPGTDVRAFTMMLVNFGSPSEASEWLAGTLAGWLVNPTW